MADRVRLWPRGALAVGALGWTFRGQTRVTAVVKVAFDRTGVPCHPATLRRVGEPDDGAWGSDGLLNARDWAPYRPGVDVLVAGHAVAPGKRPTQTFPVRLRVLQGPIALVDKGLLAVGPIDSEGKRAPIVKIALARGRSSGAAKTATNAGEREAMLVYPGEETRAVSFGSILADRPRLEDLPGVASGPQLDHDPLELPDHFDWRYFHVAPWDQRLTSLVGDEQIVLEGMRPEGTVRIALPDVRPAARLVRGRDGSGGESIGLVVDTVEIDVDRACAVLVWRGSAPCDGSFTDLGLEAWLEEGSLGSDSPPRPAVSPEAARMDVRAPRLPPRPRRAETVAAKPLAAAERTALIQATTGSRPHRRDDAPHDPVLPFRPDAPAPSRITTAMLSDDEERGPDSSGTRPMLPIDHLLAISRRTVPYRGEEGAARPGGRSPSEGQPVDACAWMVERTARSTPSTDDKLEIVQTGPSLDDAPMVEELLPNIVMPWEIKMPWDETPPLEADPDDEATLLRPGRSSDGGSDATDVDAPGSEGDATDDRKR